MEKPSAFHVETLLNLEKYHSIIDYLNQCNLFPNQVIMLVDKDTARKMIIDSLSQ